MQRVGTVFGSGVRRISIHFLMSKFLSRRLRMGRDNFLYSFISFLWAILHNGYDKQKRRTIATCQRVGSLAARQGNLFSVHFCLVANIGKTMGEIKHKQDTRMRYLSSQSDVGESLENIVTSVVAVLFRKVLERQSQLKVTIFLEVRGTYNCPILSKTACNYNLRHIRSRWGLIQSVLC